MVDRLDSRTIDLGDISSTVQAEANDSSLDGCEFNTDYWETKIKDEQDDKNRYTTHERDIQARRQSQQPVGRAAP